MMARLALSIVFLMIVWTSRDAGAQPVEVEVVVTYVAGANVYVDAGADAGLAPGDSLDVYRDGAPLGPLVVVSSTAARAVLAFAGDPFPITRGQRLLLRLRRGAGAAQEPPAVAPADTTAPVRPSLLDVPARTSPPQRKAPPVTVGGSLSLGVYYLGSLTPDQPVAGKNIARNFVTPSATLRLNVLHLPGDLTLTANVRMAYRYTSHDLPLPSRSIRIYSMTVARTFDRLPLRVEAGRFHSPFENFSGFWDGVLVRAGGRGPGLGFAAGFLPDLGNEGFTASMPKYTVFADVSHRIHDVRYDADLSYSAVYPNQTYLDHTFTGFAQRFRWRGVRLSQEIQVDRDPQTGNWVVTRLHLRNVVPIGSRIRLSGRYSLRQPYSIWRIQQVISYRRQQANVGLSYHDPVRSFSADFTANRQLGYTAQTLTAAFGFARLPFIHTGFRTSASYWTMQGRLALNVSPGFERAFGKALTRLNYRFYLSEDTFRKTTSHGIDLSLLYPLASNASLRIQAQSLFGTILISYGLNAGLWIRF